MSAGLVALPARPALELIAQAGSGETGIPFTRNCVLDTMTWSPALSPDVME